MTLGSATNATVADDTGIVTIGASGATPTSLPAISAPPDEVVGAADGYVDLPVTLNAPAVSTDTVTVSYTTADGTASGGNAFCADPTRLMKARAAPHLPSRGDHRDGAGADPRL